MPERTEEAKTPERTEGQEKQFQLEDLLEYLGDECRPEVRARVEAAASDETSDFRKLLDSLRENAVGAFSPELFEGIQRGQ